jgi:hypothetical protein
MANLTANIGLRTGVVFDVINSDSEAAVDALEAARDGREHIRGRSWQPRKVFTTLVLSIGLGSRAGVLPGVGFRGQGGCIVTPPLGSGRPVYVSAGASCQRL